MDMTGTGHRQYGQRMAGGTARRGGRLRSQAGNSLTGLLLSIQIIGIVGMVSAPRFSRTLAAYSVRGVARIVYADLQAARIGAVMANYRYRFRVVDPQTYQIHEDANGNGLVDAGERVTTAYIARYGSTLRLAATGTITFAPNGSAPTSGVVTVSNTVPGAKEVQVRVGSGGRVRITAS